jgi:hypothetical protein
VETRYCAALRRPFQAPNWAATAAQLRGFALSAIG